MPLECDCCSEARLFVCRGRGKLVVMVGEERAFVVKDQEMKDGWELQKKVNGWQM